MLQPERDWFHSFIRGEESAIKELYRLYYRKAVYYAWQLLGQQEDAEESVTDCFSSLWQLRETFQSPRHLQNSIYRIIRNDCISRLRKLHTRKKTARGWSLLQGDQAEDGTATDLEKIRSELLEKVFDIIKEMNHKQADVLYLTFFSDLSDAEIARIFQTTVNNVYLIRCRALKTLRSKLKNDSLWLFFIYIIVGLL
jgi:RNA polymerase sigma-70 factor (ECF subfamily)